MKNLVAAVTALILVVAMCTTRAQSPSNTVVRLSLATQGTNFGHMDIELFDHEKPETVRNFLLYTFSGVYSNLVLHRLASNFVMQAGHVTVPQPASSDGFFSYTPGQNFGRITNEFNVGTRFSNVFGTIAMARVSGETNSASSDWFINLNENTSLDEQDGGFTVFGRVLGSDLGNSGTNLLRFFSSFTNIVYIVTGNPFDFLTDLPVSMRRYTYTTNATNEVITVVTNNAPVQFRDLFTMNVSVLTSSRPADRKRPKLLLQEPGSKVRTITNASLAIAGIATDELEVARVLYSLNNNATEIAEGTTSWSEDLTLSPGTNVILVKSIDWGGNESKPVRRTIFYQVPSPLKLTNTAGGTIIGLTNLQMLDIGRNYKVIAKPAKNNFFVGWRGSSFHPYTALTFNMQEGTHLTAVFATNQFIAMRGNYTGVITPLAGSGSQYTAGTLTLRLGPKGQYSGRLQLLNAGYPIRGVFNQQYYSVISGYRGGVVPILLALSLQTNGTEMIVGTYTDGTNSGSVTLGRLVEGEAAPAPHAGDYTFSLEPRTNSAFGDGFGVGMTRVETSGALTISGATQDGRTFSHAAPRLSGYQWPVFAQWSETEALVGWAAFNAQSNGFSGTLFWLRPGSTNDVGENCQLTAFPFSAPAGGASPFPWNEGRLTLSGDGLTEPVGVDVSFGEGGVTVAPNSINLQAQVAGADGRVTGSFTHPVTQAATPFEAILLQTTNIAAGYFPAQDRSGSVLIQAR